jgi:hypothetical protein
MTLSDTSINHPDSVMKLVFLPKTTPGKWSVGLSLAFIFLIGLKIAGFIPIPLPTPFIALLGIAGLIVSLAAIFRNKDRSILTFLPVLVGLVILLWIAAEMIFPH